MPRTDADHPARVTPELRLLNSHWVTDRGVILRSKTSGARLVEAFARNPLALGERVGAPIKVCSVDRYKGPVQQAIKVWNDGVGVDFLQWAGIERNVGARISDYRCKIDDRDSLHELSSIIIQEFDDPDSCTGGMACAAAQRVDFDPWYGYLGRTIIAVNTRDWNRYFSDAVLANIDKGRTYSHERTRRERKRA